MHIPSKEVQKDIKDNLKKKYSGEILSLEEKIAGTLLFQEQENKISNFAKLQFQVGDEEVIEYYEFWYEQGERKNKMLSYPKSLDPRTTSNIHTLNLFKNKEYKPNIKTIYKELLELNKKYIYHSNPILFPLITLGSISSYFVEIFNTYPYFDFYGSEANCGKSTALECITYASFHGHYVTDPSKAATFRTIDNFNCMVGIDELGKLLNTKDGKAYYPMILVGHRKGGVITRCREDKYSQIDYFKVHGIKAWSRLEWLRPELLSRAITFTMIRNNGRKKLEQNPHYKDLKHIRNDLYIIRLLENEFVKEIYYDLLESTTLVDRTRDIFLPLLTIAKLIDPNLYDTILDFAEEYHKKASIITINIWNTLLLETIYSCNLFGEIKIVDIKEAFNQAKIEAQEDSVPNFTSQRIITLLEKLGFQRSEKRTGNNVHFFILWDNFKEQSHVYLKHIENITKPEEEQQTLPTPPQPNLTNLPNSTGESTK